MTSRTSIATFFRDAMEAAQREPSDVIDADADERMSDEDFDSALWSALCGRLDRGASFADWPGEVQTYFATRYVEWEVGNGGFRQALANESRHYVAAAIAGYEVPGRPDSRRFFARPSQRHDATLERLDRVMVVDDRERVAYVRAHTDAFRA